jgi:hypothetical protein
VETDSRRNGPGWGECSGSFKIKNQNHWRFLFKRIAQRAQAMARFEIYVSAPISKRELLLKTLQGLMAKPEEAEEILKYAEAFRSLGEMLNTREEARLFYERVMTELGKEGDVRWIWQKNAG